MIILGRLWPALAGWARADVAPFPPGPSEILRMPLDAGAGLMLLLAGAAVFAGGVWWARSLARGNAKSPAQRP